MRVRVFKLFAQLDIIYDPQLIPTKGIATTSIERPTSLTNRWGILNLESMEAHGVQMQS